MLSCHGTVASVDDIPAFVKNIRRGRPVPAEVVQEVRHRFELIGGSPMMRITHQQAEALEHRLHHTKVRAAARLWHPYPAEVLAELQADGVDAVVSLPLAPQSTHVYNAAVEAAAESLGMPVVSAPSWGLQPELITAFVGAIGEVLAAASVDDGLAVVLTAHSLPTRIIAAGDPYERDFRSMAETVAAALGPQVSRDRIRIAFQSQGMTGGDWLGPDLATTFAELRATGFDKLVIAPIGFLAEHVETLYDIDIEAAAAARELGFTVFERMPAMNTRKAFVDALEAVARPLLDQVASGSNG